LPAILIIPFGLIGAVAGHWVMGYRAYARSAVLSLTILLFWWTVNKQRKAGISLQEAVLNADVIRFRRTL